MVRSLDSNLFNSEKVVQVNGQEMEDRNNNVETCPRVLERSDPRLGTSESDPRLGTSDCRKQPLDNVNLVFTSNGENFSITLHEVIGRFVNYFIN